MGREAWSPVVPIQIRLSGVVSLLDCLAGAPERDRAHHRSLSYDRSMRIRPGIEVSEQELAVLCQRFGVQSLALFGSSARGDHKDDSDVDLLVAFKPSTRVGLLHLSGLQLELEALLGVPVDLVPRGGLKPVIRGAVLEEARELYAA